MNERETDLISLLEQALAGNSSQEQFEEIGTVIKIGDGVCKVHGLSKAMFGELIAFEHGCFGIVMDLDEDYVAVVLLDGKRSVMELEVARRTGKVFSIPVGQEVIGRVINVRGQAVDGLGELSLNEFLPIDIAVSGISERQPINSSLETGIVAIDALIPIGRGQRELLIGNRGTGKTSIAIDTIVHQRGQNIICIYVSIGHKQSTTAKIINYLQEQGALEYTIVVNAHASESPLNLYLSPYVGCTLGEYFMRKGRDVLIVYDDLTTHATAYRELSLLLRRPPGREAYPGDIFFIHSRLLERAGKLSAECGGGSLTALPIIQTQGDDISAYIPTNLISITDGQIFLDAQLFKSGVRPAVNVGLSVSRVGGAAQTKAMRKVAGMLRLDLAQYHELLAFAQFGSELDKASQRSLERGRRAVEILKQDESEHYSFVEQVLFLYLLKEQFLDKLALADVKAFVDGYARYFEGMYSSVYQKIATSQDFSKEDENCFKQAAEEFALVFVP